LLLRELTIASPGGNWAEHGCIGLVFISQLNAQSSVSDIIWRLLFVGIGQAIFQSPNSSALMGAAFNDRVFGNPTFENNARAGVRGGVERGGGLGLTLSGGRSFPGSRVGPAG
jgi:hypothetical protein